MDFSIPPTKLVYHPLSRLVPLFIQQRYDTNPAVRSTCSQKIFLLCLSGVEGLLSGAQKPLHDHVTNLQLRKTHPSGVPPSREHYIIGRVGRRRGHLYDTSIPQGRSGTPFGCLTDKPTLVYHYPNAQRRHPCRHPSDHTSKQYCISHRQQKSGSMDEGPAHMG